MRQKGTYILVGLLFCCLSLLAAPDPVKERLQKIYPGVERMGEVYVVNQGMMKAVYNKDGKPLTEFIYNDVKAGIGKSLLAETMTRGTHLLSSQGKFLTRFYQFRIDTVANVYKTGDGNSNTDVYDEEGKLLMRYYEGTYVNNEMVKNGLKLRVNGDSISFYNLKGKFLFSCESHETEVYANGLIGIKLYGLWSLRDTTGKILQPPKYYSISGYYKNILEGGQTVIINNKGKEVYTGYFSIIKEGLNGWYIVNSVNYKIGDVLLDKNFKLAVQAPDSKNIDFVGSRFAKIGESYDDDGDGDVAVYDMRFRKYVDYDVLEAISDDTYVIRHKGSTAKRVLQGTGIKALPAFKSIQKPETNSDRNPSALHYYVISDEEKTEQDHQGRWASYKNEELNERRIARSMRDLVNYTPTIPTGRLGLLDSVMRLVVPMSYNSIKILSNDRQILAMKNDGSGEIYNWEGKVQVKLARGTVITDEGAVVRAVNGAVTRLYDTYECKLLYQGDEHPSVAFLTENRKPVKPMLLLPRNEKGEQAVYDMTGKQLLPYGYHQLPDRVPGIVTIKKDDSVYFVSMLGQLLYGGRGFVNSEVYMLESYAMLMKKYDKWGVLFVDGTVMLPFEYDELLRINSGDYGDNFSNYALGKNKQYALLKNTGELMYPLQNWKPQKIEHNGIRSEDYNLYWVEDGNVHLVYNGNYENNGGNRRGYVEDSTGYIVDKNNAGIEPGVYNLSDKKIAEVNPKYRPSILMNSILITDTSATNVSVIDSNGNTLLPFMPRPEMLIHNRGNLTIVNRRGNDILYERTATGFVKKEILIDSTKKSELLKLVGSHYKVSNTDFTFSAPGGVRGYANGWGGRSVTWFENVENEKNIGWMHMLKVNGKWALLDGRYNEISPAVLDTITTGNNGNVFWLYTGDKIGMYDQQTASYISPIYDEIYAKTGMPNRLAIVKRDGLFYVINKHDRIISAPYDSIDVSAPNINSTTAFRKGVTYALSIDGNARIAEQRVGATGVKVMGIERDYLGMVRMKENDLMGVYSNTKFSYILPPIYDYIERSNNYENAEYFTAWKYYKDKKQGVDSTIFLRNDGKIIFKLKGWYNPKRFSDTMFAMRGEKGAPLMSVSGKVIVPDSFDAVDVIETNRRLFQVDKDRLTGIMNIDGKLTMKPKVTHIYDDKDLPGGYMRATLEGSGEDKWFLINDKGYLVTPNGYRHLDVIVDYDKNATPYFAALKGRDWHIIDGMGKEVLPTGYSQILQVYKQMVIVSKDNKWGIIDLKGKVLVDFKYDYIDYLRDGRAAFKRGEVTGYLDETGKETEVSE